MLETMLFTGLVLLIVFVSYKLGYEKGKQRIQAQLPLYRALVSQHTMMVLVASGYLNGIEEDGKIIIVPLNYEGDSGESEKDSRTEEEA